MKTRCFQWIVGLFFFFVVAHAFSSPATSQLTSPAKEDEGATADCLKCHGPFDKLASAPPSFISTSGEKITPHRYVPHDQKDIPDCANCHQPHSANPTADEIAALPKPNVTFCFDCHHKKNFMRCKACHK
jgi:predicted CXXCH cytochrome family protein